MNLFKQKPTLIYICGSHSVGKSTLITDYCKYLMDKNIFYNRNESPRDLVPLDKLYNQVDDLTQMYITFGTLSSMADHFDKDRLYITDRFLVDNIAYATSSPLTTRRLHKIHTSLLFHFLKVWDVKTFYLPIEFPIEKDGVRPEDEQYRGQVDQYLRGLLTSFNISYTILEGSRENRLNKLIKKAGF